MNTQDTKAAKHGYSIVDGHLIDKEGDDAEPQWILYTLDKLQAQRDELLAACKLALLVMTDSILCGSDDINQVKRAIARAEGGQP